jgi:hypothetical protein
MNLADGHVMPKGRGGRDALRSYAIATLVDHHVRAGRPDAVHRLLRREGREGAAWYELKQGADDDRGYERDISLAWQLADAEFREASVGVQRAGAVALQVQYALVSASLGELSDRLTPQELRRHVSSRRWSMARARATAARASDTTVRAQMFAELVGAGTDSDLRGLIGDAVGDASREAVLGAVAQRLAPQKLSWVVAAARAIGSEDAIAVALVVTAPRLLPEDVEPLLREAMNLTSRDARARAVVALAPRAPASLADEVVIGSGLLDDDATGLVLLETQASSLSPVAAEQGLEFLGRQPATARRTALAVVLLDAVPLDRRKRLLQSERKAAGQIRSLDARAVALSTLGLSAQAVQVAAEISPASRAATIVTIAPHLTPVAARKAIDALADVRSPFARGEALVALAARVEPSAAFAVLAAADAIRPEKAKATIVAVLAPRLPAARLSYALRLALRIRDLDVRQVAVAALEPRLTARHRATSLYRRRAGGTAGIDVAAALRKWSAQSPTRRTPPPRRRSSTAESQPVDVNVPTADESSVEHADAAAVREWLIGVIRHDQADYAALQHWLGKLSAGSDRPREAHAFAGGAGSGPTVRRDNWAEATLRRHLREQLAARLVHLDDPKVQAALDLTDPATLRTALHLGLEWAESRDSDDQVFAGPSALAQLVPLFARYGRLRDLTEAARDLPAPYRRAEALVAALPYLGRDERTAGTAEASASLAAACQGSSPRMWWKRLAVLDLLAPELENSQIEDLAAELKKLARRGDANVPPGDSRGAVLIESQLLLLLHATPPTAAALSADVLDVAGRMHSEVVREAVLDALVPRLQPTALGAAAGAARTLPGPRRALALASVARRAAQVDARDEASGLMEEIAGMPDLFGDPTVSTLVGRHADLLTPAALAAIWCPEPGKGLLHTANGASRVDLIRVLDDVAAALTLLGGPETNDAVAEVREVVTRWWP